MIRKLTVLRAFAELCRASKSWGLYVSHGGPSATPAAPYLDPGDPILVNGQGIILCETEAEMLDLFGRTVGDDGPTAQNPYDGPDRVYALTCSPEGEFLNENT